MSLPAAPSGSRALSSWAQLAPVRPAWEGRAVTELPGVRREGECPEKVWGKRVPGVQLCYAERRDSPPTICGPRLNLLL